MTNVISVCIFKIYKYKNSQNSPESSNNGHGDLRIRPPLFVNAHSPFMPVDVSYFQMRSISITDLFPRYFFWSIVIKLLSYIHANGRTDKVIGFIGSFAPKNIQ